MSHLPFLNPHDQVNQCDNSTIIYFYRHKQNPKSIRQSFAHQTF